MSPELRKHIQAECADACEQVIRRLDLDWDATLVLRGPGPGEWIVVTSDDLNEVINVIRKQDGAP